MKIFFEFVGGPRDGEILEGSPENADIAEFDIDAATAYYWETVYGRLDSEFFVLSPYAQGIRLMNFRGPRVPPEHKYEIVERLDEKDEAWVVAQYVGPVAYKDVPSEHHYPWNERLVNLGITEVTSVHKNFPELPLNVVG